MKQNNNINQEIAKIKNLPPLPEESVRILTAINNPDISIDELVNVISASPVLVARLLGLANSAYFGCTGKITDLRRAIIQVLGLNLVKSLALSIVINLELDTSKCPLFDTQYFWSHALATAFIAQNLATQLRDEQLEQGIVYTSALLLNVGLLASVQSFPDKVNEALSHSDRLEGSVSKQMKEIVGETQYTIGEMLLKRWQLPEVYRIVLKEFRNENFVGKERKMIELLELSHWLGAYILSDKEDEMPELSDMMQALALSKQNLEKVIEDIANNKDNINELAIVIGG
jgi:HD-like signal output (HDOD) protein